MATGGLAIVVVVVGVVIFYASTRKEPPPTSAPPGHAETLPRRQINDSPIPKLVQQHVMERNSTHPAGQMLVQYNCEDYQCEPDLVAKLTEIVLSYPSTVYLAPYPVMEPRLRWRRRAGSSRLRAGMTRGYESSSATTREDECSDSLGSIELGG